MKVSKNTKNNETDVSILGLSYYSSPKPHSRRRAGTPPTQYFADCG